MLVIEKSGWGSYESSLTYLNFLMNQINSKIKNYHKQRVHWLKINIQVSPSMKEVKLS